jgi:type III restriction enzyme
MDDRFFTQPILNNPYEYPSRHWELDDTGQPTQRIEEYRRSAQFITPIPKPKKRRGSAKQIEMVLDEGEGLSDDIKAQKAGICQSLASENYGAIYAAVD